MYASFGEFNLKEIMKAYIVVVEMSGGLPGLWVQPEVQMWENLSESSFAEWGPSEVGNI